MAKTQDTTKTAAADPAAAPQPAGAAPQVVITPEAAEALGKAIAGALGPGIRHGASVAETAGKAFEPEGGGFNKDDRLARRNKHGGMLMYRVSFAPKRETKYNTISGVINDYRYAIQRGVVVEVPWFVVDFWRTNTEMSFHQGKDAAGNNIVVATEGPQEALTLCVPIDPPEGFVDGEPISVSEARWQAEQARAAEKVAA